MSSQQHKDLYKKGIIDTTDGKPPESFDGAAPGPIKENGQHSQYWVLSESERAKGVVRPVRQSYVHVGIAGPAYPTRPLNQTELERGLADSFYCYEEYPDEYREKNNTTAIGKYWTKEQMDSIGKGCRTTTTMGLALSETFAVNPHYYGSTFCCGCGTHLPVGKDGEFVWLDGERVGT